ncbi:hypothetical protein F53441_8120 [Fusarium austroafricanum]|uniref:Uncharacterized protein n=1 Tax=Fusarium austroafricanum TaxID=2364996 RepID=A0A8H4KC04_9HYPO|nr:hypothetical protein F53441_8120 [Fusarium austroafricanum]
MTRPFVSNSSGQKVLDASAGPAVLCLGFGRPEVTEAITNQVNQLAYLYSGARFTCDATEELAVMLLQGQPGGLSKAIFVNSGCEATDAAIKLATQYWHERGALCVSGHDSRRALYRDWLPHNVSFVDPCFAYRLKGNNETDEAYVKRLADQLEAEILGPLSLRHRGYALTSLRESMQQSDLSTEMTLALTMVFCSMESISEATDSWYSHLVGAAAALACPYGPAATDPKYTVQSTFEGRWLLRNFAYHDVMMSVSMDCRPLIRGFYWSSKDGSLADPYFGFASRLLFQISETSILNAEFAERQEAADDDSASTYGELFAKYYAIEDDLQNWVCP